MLTLYVTHDVLASRHSITFGALVPGYYEFMKNIPSKDSETRWGALRWYGKPYDPDDIGEQNIISALRQLGATRRSDRMRALPR